MFHRPALRHAARRARSFVSAALVILQPVIAALALMPQPAHADVASGDIVYYRLQNDDSSNPLQLAKLGSGGTITPLSDGDPAHFANQANPPGIGDFEPDVSTDGSRIAFIGLRPAQDDTSSPPHQKYVLSVMNSDGSGEANLHAPLKNQIDPSTGLGVYLADYAPSWSPNGQQIAYMHQVSESDNETYIYKIDADGANDTQLTSGGVEEAPAWSPDGTKIAYNVFIAQTGGYLIHVMNSDGSGDHLISSSNTGYSEAAPRWSPDGTKVYFANSGGGIWYYSSTDGFATTQTGAATQASSYSPTPLTGYGGDVYRFDVSADGNTLAYAATTATSPNCRELWTISSSGGTPSQKTSSASGSTCTYANASPAFVDNAWPPTYCDASTICISAPSPSDAPYTRQVTIGLSSTGVKEFQYCWSTVGSGSDPGSDCSSHVQTTTDTTNKKGTLNYLGVYSGSGTTWYDSTSPNSDYYLWVRSINTDGSANAWNGGGSNTPLFVHTPRRPAWVVVGDSYSSGHNQPQDEPGCPTEEDAGFWSSYNCPGGPNFYREDTTFTWVNSAITNFNVSQHLPSNSAWQITWGATDSSTGLPAYFAARSGAATSSFGTANLTPGTEAWASTGQAATVHSALYPRQDSWNVVSMTGGADDSNWTSVLAHWYPIYVLTHPLSAQPWAQTDRSDCPDTQSVMDSLNASTGPTSTVNSDITANLQGIATIATAASPGVRVLNVGYPYVVDSTNVCYSQSPSTNNGVKSVIDKLNDDHKGVTGANVSYVDLASDFGPSAVSNNYLQLTRLYGWPHANATGQARISDLAQASLVGATWGPGGTDYASNGTFESGSAAGWNDTSTNTTPGVSTTVAHSGTNSMTLVYGSDVTDSPNFIDANTSNSVGVDPVDFWAKGPSGKTIRVKLRQYLAGGNNELYQSFTLDGNWDHFVTKALHVYPGYSVDLNFDVPDAASGDVFYLDDIHEYGYASTEDCGYQNLVGSGGLNADAIENCGGEAPYGTQYWVPADSANPTLTSDTDDAHDGSYSFKLVAANSGTMSMNDSPDARYLGEVSTSATSCTATAWMKSPSTTGTLKLRIREYNGSQGGLMGTATSTATPDGSWQQLTVTRTLASGHDANSHLDLYAYMTNAAAGDVVRIDHITETCQ